MASEKRMMVLKVHEAEQQSHIQYQKTKRGSLDTAVDIQTNGGNVPQNPTIASHDGNVYQVHKDKLMRLHVRIGQPSFPSSLRLKLLLPRDEVCHALNHLVHEGRLVLAHAIDIGDIANAVILSRRRKTT